MAQTQGQPARKGRRGRPARARGCGWLKSIYGNKALAAGADTVILLGIAALVVVGFLMMQDRGFTVEFRTDGGSQVASQKLMYGDLVQRPEDPVKEGYTFEGWYWDDEYKLAWNFDTDTVTGDMYLVAKWAEKDAAGAAQSESGAAG
ncbi:MAG: InlB B-repeat-containing protein [Ruthenibacterium sp.]